MIETALAYTFPAAFALLPGVMDSPEARALLLAIGMQESGFRARRQIRGPARGFWQFEQTGGTAAVLAHEASRPHAAHVCTELLYPPTAAACYPALEHNDVLACCFARLLLWTLPDRLAQRGQPERAWAQYLAAWRPGTPREATWPDYVRQAWHLVETDA